MAFTIAQISDSHLSDRKPFFVANFERVCVDIRRRHPDLVLNSGDISLNGASEEDDLLAARRLHEAIGLPVRAIPGNHDVGDNADVPRSGHAIGAAGRARYIDHFGADWWTLDIPGWCLIGINAQLLGSNLPAAVEQETFIAGSVAEAAGRHIALFSHKPLCDRAVDEQVVGGRFLNPVPRRRLLDCLDGETLALIASGHVHQFRATSVDGTSHVWAPSCGFVFPDELQPRYGVKEVGYVLHHLHPDGRCESELVRPAGVEPLRITDFPDAYDHKKMRQALAASDASV